MLPRHLTKLAKALRSQKPGDAYTEEHEYAFKQWAVDCRAIAGACHDLNTAFNSDRFLSECGLL